MSEDTTIDQEELTTVLDSIFVAAKALLGVHALTLTFTKGLTEEGMDTFVRDLSGSEANQRIFLKSVQLESVLLKKLLGNLNYIGERIGRDYSLNSDSATRTLATIFNQVEPQPNEEE
jgi:hypothetical protein